VEGDALVGVAELELHRGRGCSAEDPGARAAGVRPKAERSAVARTMWGRDTGGS
jgi:hypothetical protein